jgi:hypothetical protein
MRTIALKNSIMRTIALKNSIMRTISLKNSIMRTIALKLNICASSHNSLREFYAIPLNFISDFPLKNMIIGREFKAIARRLREASPEFSGRWDIESGVSLTVPRSLLNGSLLEVGVHVREGSSDGIPRLGSRSRDILFMCWILVGGC